MAAFSSGSFSTDAFSVLAFDFDSSPGPEFSSRGGIDERDYHRYRKHLEKVMQVTQEAEQRKYIRTIAEDVEILNELPVNTEELDKILEGPQLKGKLKLTPDIDFEQLKGELLLIQQYLDARFRYIEQLREQDDEAAFLLLLQ